MRAVLNSSSICPFCAYHEHLCRPNGSDRGEAPRTGASVALSTTVHGSSSTGEPLGGVYFCGLPRALRTAPSSTLRPGSHGSAAWSPVPVVTWTRRACAGFSCVTTVMKHDDVSFCSPLFRPASCLVAFLRSEDVSV